MDWSSYRQERSDLLGYNFPLWCWGMFLCKPAVRVFPGVGFMVMVPGCLPSGLLVVRGVDWPVQLMLAGGMSVLEPAWNLQLWIGPPVRGLLLTFTSCSVFKLLVFPSFLTFESRISRKTNFSLFQPIFQPHLLHISRGISHLSCATQQHAVDPDCQTITSDTVPADGWFTQTLLTLLTYWGAQS